MNTVIQIRQGVEAPDERGPGVVRHVASSDAPPSRPATFPSEDWLEAARLAFRDQWWLENGDKFEFSRDAYGETP